MGVNELSATHKTEIFNWMKNYKSYDCRVDGVKNFDASWHAGVAGTVPACSDVYTVDHSTASFPPYGQGPNCPYSDAGIQFSDFSGTAYGDAEGFINKDMTEQVIKHNHKTW